MTRTTIIALSTALAGSLCGTATAESFDSPAGTFDVSMTATLASDYIWRGQSQTGGTVVVLGETGRNFGAGMSGGVAYVYDPDRSFAKRCNLAMVDLEPVLPHAEQAEAGHIEIWHSQTRGGERETDDAILRRLIESHYRYTGSFLSRDLISDWSRARGNFVKVMPKEYRRALKELWQAANPEQIAA